MSPSAIMFPVIAVGFGSWTGGSSFPVWYAHYPTAKSFSDFSPFGGWTTPFMKQYNGDQPLCGADVDLDWVPAGSYPQAEAIAATSSASGIPAYGIALIAVAAVLVIASVIVVVLKRRAQPGTQQQRGGEGSFFKHR